MGFGGISPWSLLLILGIVILLFGTKRLRNVGGDLGSALKNFKKSMRDGEESSAEEADQQKLDSEQPGGQVIDAKAEHNKDKA